MYPSTLMTTLVVAAALLLSPSMAEEKDDGHKIERPSRASYVQDSDCIINGYLYRHGQVFTLGNNRCIKYRCANGMYDFHEEACDAFGQCHAVNRDFQHKCRTYRCTVTNVGNNYNHYRVTSVGRQMCEDYYGQCHAPGARFVYNMRGRLQSGCTCMPQKDFITYSCQGMVQG